MDVPDEDALEDDSDENDEKDGEEDGLVVEDGDGFWRGANAGEPIELTHFDYVWWLYKWYVVARKWNMLSGDIAKIT